MGGKLELGADVGFARMYNDITVDAGVTAPPFPTITTSIDRFRLRAVYQMQKNLSVVGQLVVRALRVARLAPRRRVPVDHFESVGLWRPAAAVQGQRASAWLAVSLLNGDMNGPMNVTVESPWLARRRRCRRPPVPRYLEQVYWWAYVHPNAVHVFEREWLVNRSCSATTGGCATRRWPSWATHGARPHAAGGLRVRRPHAAAAAAAGARRAARRGRHPADPAARTWRASCRPTSGCALLHGDSVGAGRRRRQLRPGAAVLPAARAAGATVRRATLAEALRVVKPGGQVVIVDYHRPLRLASAAAADAAGVPPARAVRDGPVATTRSRASCRHAQPRIVAQAHLLRRPVPEARAHSLSRADHADGRLQGRCRDRRRRRRRPARSHRRGRGRSVADGRADLQGLSDAQPHRGRRRRRRRR